MEIAAVLADTLARYEALFGPGPATVAFHLFLNSTKTPASRTNLAGHTTGSALLWHPSSNRVLRVYHAKLDRWVFSAGGHMEPGEMPWESSRRELAEEIGVRDVELCSSDLSLPLPLVLDAHPIPASPRKSEPAHWHYDMVYLYRVVELPDLFTDPSEVAEFRWVDIDSVTTENAPVDLREQINQFMS